MSRLALSPRAALLLVGVVLFVAVAVVVLGGGTGAGSSGSGSGSGSGSEGVAVVTGAPTAAPPAPTRTPTVQSGPAAPGADPSGSPAAVLYVVGAVAHAGVVRVPQDARIADAVAAAGGATAEADLSRLNLARPVVDGERLYVPTAGETEVPSELPVGGVGGSSSGTGSSGAGSVAGGAGSTADAVVDLNAADATTLETLPGIGPALAERIIAWRDEHGGFRSAEDLLEVSGIGEARFAELQDRVRV